MCITMKTALTLDPLFFDHDPFWNSIIGVILIALFRLFLLMILEELGIDIDKDMYEYGGDDDERHEAH